MLMLFLLIDLILKPQHNNIEEHLIGYYKMEKHFIGELLILLPSKLCKSINDEKS